MTMHTPEVEEELLAPEPVEVPELPGYRVAFQDSYGLALVREQDWGLFSSSP